MTRISPAEACAVCGSPLIPPSLSSELTTPSAADYVCPKCHRFYQWTGSPPRLTPLVAIAHRPVSDVPEPVPAGTRADLRFLFIEDNADDAELEARDLRKAGLHFVSERVWTEEQFLATVDDFQPDLILCDYSLPGTDGMSFLRLCREICPRVPFMFVSGTIGEERAIEALKNGACDYVLKDRQGSLALRVRRVIEETRQRKRRELVEEQLHQAQKIDAISRLAGGMVHDLNNLLTVISGYSEMSLHDVTTPGPLRTNLEETFNAARRAGALTRQLLTFSGRRVAEHALIDLNAVIVDVERMISRVVGADVRVVTELAPDLRLTKADPVQVQQMLMTLALNARDAMPNGGWLTLRTRNVELSADEVRGQPNMAPGQYVTLEVSDTGVGMSRQTLEHVFEPFFTTKEPGAGTGLGLSAVYGIARQCGGTIWVFSEIGHGTSFEICLPRADGVVQPLSIQAPAQLHGSETILLVEFDETVRLVAKAALEGYGYTVLDARDAFAAIHLAKQHVGRIHMLVTDLVMPGMNGEILAAHVAVCAPKVKVMYVSDTPDVAQHEEFVAERGRWFLAKPYTPTALISKIREALDAGK